MRRKNNLIILLLALLVTACAPAQNRETAIVFLTSDAQARAAENQTTVEALGTRAATQATAIIAPTRTAQAQATATTARATAVMQTREAPIAETRSAGEALRAAADAALYATEAAGAAMLSAINTDSQTDYATAEAIVAAAKTNDYLNTVEREARWNSTKQFLLGLLYVVILFLATFAVIVYLYNQARPVVFAQPEPGEIMLATNAGVRVLSPARTTPVRELEQNPAPLALPAVVNAPADDDIRPNVLPLGVAPSGNIAMRFDEPGNLLVGGAEGSGKSSFLYWLAYLALLNRYNLFLIDTEGKSFIPDMWGAVGHDETTATQQLQWLNAFSLGLGRLYSEAFRLARDAGQSVMVDSLPRYNAIAERFDLPHVRPTVLLVEEAQPLLASNETGALLGEIMRTGRKSGIMVVIAAQVWHANSVPTAVRHRLTNRLAFRSTPGTSRVILDGDTSAARIVEPGRAILSSRAETIPVQTYLLEQQRLVQAARPLPRLADRPTLGLLPASVDTERNNVSQVERDAREIEPYVAGNGSFTAVLQSAENAGLPGWYRKGNSDMRERVTSALRWLGENGSSETREQVRQMHNYPWQ